jgi:hypothetical protein
VVDLREVDTRPLRTPDVEARGEALRAAGAEPALQSR